jgi:hypothetical protein
VGACVPPAPKKLIDPRPNRPVVLHSADAFVDADGLCDCTDWSGVMEYKGCGWDRKRRQGAASVPGRTVYLPQIFL